MKKIYSGQAYAQQISDKQKRSVSGSFSAISLVILLAMFFVSNISAQQTVGIIINESGSYDGYTLFAPMQGNSAYLIDNYGRIVHQWDNPGVRPGHSVYLLDNGHLLWNVRLTGVNGGAHIMEFDWDGNLVWNWADTSDAYYQHHDVAPVPNGNVLILARDFKSAAEAFQAGRDTLELLDTVIWSEMVFEVQPTGLNSGTVVWEWRAWDHLIQDFDPSKDNFGVVADHPELMDINFGNHFADWLHSNALDYDPIIDQIAISHRPMNEFWVIDHSTTTAEAASHAGGVNGKGGDIIYRWGNPLTYQAGDSTDQQLSFQHNIHWIPQGVPGAGNMMVYNNGNLWSHSAVVEIETSILPDNTYPTLLPLEAHLPVSIFWEYQDNPPESLFSAFISGAQRLPNGNTLVCDGPKGNFREVTNSGQIVWRYQSPISGATGPVIQGVVPSGTATFRAYRFGADSPPLLGRDLTPTSALEIYSVTISGTVHTPIVVTGADTIGFTTTLTTDSGITSSVIMVDTGSGYFALPLLDDGLSNDGVAGDDLYGSILGTVSDGKTINYYVEIVDGNTVTVNDPPFPANLTYSLQVEYSCGNIDGVAGPSGPTDISDLTYLVNYLFKAGPPPPDLNAANVNGILAGDIPVDIADLTYLVNYLFKLGPAPNCSL